MSPQFIEDKIVSTVLSRGRAIILPVWAENLPDNLKYTLKRRGYRWSNGTNRRGRSWYIDVNEDKRDAELAYLKQEIDKRDIYIHFHEITALDRFSNRA